MEVEFGGGVAEEDILARLKAWRNDLQAKPSYSELAAGAEGGGFEEVAGSQAKISASYPLRGHPWLWAMTPLVGSCAAV